MGYRNFDASHQYISDKILTSWNVKAGSIVVNYPNSMFCKNNIFVFLYISFMKSQSLILWLTGFLLQHNPLHYNTPWWTFRTKSLYFWVDKVDITLNSEKYSAVIHGLNNACEVL